MTNAMTRTPLWGDVFADADAAALFAADPMLQRMLAFEAAWTGALGDTGRVAQGDAATAARAIAGFRPDLDAIAAGTARDGLPVPALVRQLRAAAGDAAAPAIHTGATSQDVIDTAMVLTCDAALGLLCARLDLVLTALADLHKAHGAAPLMGRTRMQAALPVTAGHRIASWQQPLLRLRQDHAALRDRLRVVQIGGPVGLRAEGDDFAARVAAALGLDCPGAWHSDRARFADLGHWLMLLTGALGKLGQDVALMAQQGVDAIALAGGGGSSAMPHKQNPVRAETLVALARFVAGQQAVLGQALIHEQERSGAAWPLEWLTLPAMVEASAAALRHAAALLAQITAIGDAGHHS